MTGESQILGTPLFMAPEQVMGGGRVVDERSDLYALGAVAYYLLTGEEPEQAVKLGWAHGALITTYPGDTTMATVEQVRALAQGGSARIQR